MPDDIASRKQKRLQLLDDLRELAADAPQRSIIETHVKSLEAYISALERRRGD